MQLIGTMQYSCTYYTPSPEVHCVSNKYEYIWQKLAGSIYSCPPSSLSLFIKPQSSSHIQNPGQVFLYCPHKSNQKQIISKFPILSPIDIYKDTVCIYKIIKARGSRHPMWTRPLTESKVGGVVAAQCSSVRRADRSAMSRWQPAHLLSNWQLFIDNVRLTSEQCGQCSASSPAPCWRPRTHR